VELVDDLDGGRADETVNFALDGVAYVIDLSAEHATRLREVLAEFVGHASKVSRRARRAATNGNAQDGPGDDATRRINRARELAEATRARPTSQGAEPAPGKPASPANGQRPAAKPLAEPPAEPMAAQRAAEQPVTNKSVSDPLFSRKADATDIPKSAAPGTGAALIVPFKTAEH